VDLPENINKLLDKLETLSIKYNGLHAASGTLDSKKGHHVRMALLSIIFKSAGLPGQYNLAQL